MASWSETQKAAIAAGERIEVAYDNLLLAACVFPKEVQTQVGTRDLMHRLVEELNRLRGEVQDAIEMQAPAES